MSGTDQPGGTWGWHPHNGPDPRLRTTWPVVLATDPSVTIGIERKKTVRVGPDFLTTGFDLAGNRYRLADGLAHPMD